LSVEALGPIIKYGKKRDGKDLLVGFCDFNARLLDDQARVWLVEPGAAWALFAPNLSLIFC